MQHSVLLLDAARRGRRRIHTNFFEKGPLVCLVYEECTTSHLLANVAINQARLSCHGRLCATIMLHLYGLLCPDRTCLATASQLGEQ